MISYRNLDVKKSQFKLSNKIKVTLFYRKKSPISLILVFPKGSKFDPVGKKGLYHFLEHMLLNGSENFSSSEEIFKYVENRGGWINAFTTKDSLGIITVFGDKKDLKDFIRLLHDLVCNPIFDSRKIKNEKNVVIQEVNKELIDNDLFIDTAKDEMFFSGNSISSSILGLPGDIQSFNVEDLRSVHKNLFNEGFSIVCGGDIERDELSKILEQTFGDLKVNVTHSNYENMTFRPIRNKIRKTENNQISVLYGYRMSEINDEDVVYLDVINSLLGNGGSSLLVNKVRNDKGLVYAINTINSLYNDFGVFGVVFDTSKENIGKVLAIIKKEINKLKKTGVGKADLDIAKNKLVKMAKVTYETPYEISFYFSKWCVNTNNSYLELPAYLNKIMDCSVGDIKRVANKYFATDSVGIVAVGNITNKEINSYVS